MRIIAEILLFLIDLSCLHFPLTWVTKWMLVLLGLEEYLEAARSANELDELQWKLDRFRALHPLEAKSVLNFDRRLEIIACASSIRRQIQARRNGEWFDPAELEQDWADFHGFVYSRMTLLQLEPIYAYSGFLQHLEECRDRAMARYESALGAYYG